MSDRGPRKPGVWKEWALAYGFLAPAFLVLAVFVLYPLVAVLVISLFRGWGTKSVTFCGMENFDRVFGGGDFWESLLITIYYVVGTAPVALVLSFVIAAMLHRQIRGRAFYRSAYFLPYVTSTVAAAAVFGWIFGLSERSPANIVLHWIGVPRQFWTQEPRGIVELLANGVGIADFPTWAGGPSLALVCVMLFSIWHMLGFNIVVFLAGMTTIPREIHEAAEVDGASWFQRTFRVTLPLLSPTVFFLTLISVIRAFQTFNDVYILTPYQRTATTRNVIMLIYNNMVDRSDFGYGSAISFVLFLIILLLTLIQIRLFERKVHYQ